MNLAAGQKIICDENEIMEILNFAAGERLTAKLQLLELEEPIYANIFEIHGKNIMFRMRPDDLDNLPFHVNDEIEIGFSIRHKGYFAFKGVFLGAPRYRDEFFMVHRVGGIETMQRRAHYRVEPGMTLSAICEIVEGPLKFMQPEVINISMSGVRLAFPVDVSVEVGDFVEGIALTLQGHSPIIITGFVRSVFKDIDGHHNLGIEWASITAEQLAVLRAYMIACQREEIRLIKRIDD